MKSASNKNFIPENTWVKVKGTHDARCIRYVTRHKNEEYFEDDGTVVDRNPSLDNKSGEFFY